MKRNHSKTELLEPRKIDASVNGNAEELSLKHREVERSLYQLRIDKNTVILAPKHKCNEEYRQEWIRKLNNTKKYE